MHISSLLPYGPCIYHPLLPSGPCLYHPLLPCGPCIYHPFFLMDHVYIIPFFLMVHAYIIPFFLVDHVLMVHTYIISFFPIVVHFQPALAVAAQTVVSASQVWASIFEFGPQSVLLQYEFTFGGTSVLGSLHISYHICMSHLGSGKGSLVCKVSYGVCAIERHGWQCNGMCFFFCVIVCCVSFLSGVHTPSIHCSCARR